MLFARALAVATLCLAACINADMDHSGHDHATDHGSMDMGSGGSSNSGNGNGNGNGSGGTSGMSGSGMDMNMPDCVESSNRDKCESYTYPARLINEDLDSLCDAMPFMVVCGLREECDGGSVEGSEVCEPFRLLATGCADEGMSGMAGCTRYNSLCDGQSAVAQCGEEEPVPQFIATMATQEMIVMACNDHSMPGCEECTGTGAACPNTLMTAATVCHAHRMDHCADFYAMCDANGDALGAVCDPTASGANYDPPMRMYFHEGIRDMVLFRNAVATNDGEFAGIWLAVFITGIIATALRLFRGNWEGIDRLRMSKATREQPDIVAEQSLFKLPKASILPHLGRTLLSFFVMLLDYSLMLIAMTFNVGLFFAVVLGLAVGMLLFSPVAARQMQRAQAREIQHARKCDCADTTNLEAKHIDGMKDGSSQSPRSSGSGAPAPCTGGNQKMCCDTKTALSIAENGQTTDTTPSCCAV